MNLKKLRKQMIKPILPESKRLRVALIAFIFILAVFMIYLIVKKPYMSGFQMPPVVVSAMKVQTDSWQAKLMAVCTVRAIDGVDATTEIPRLVYQVLFTPGTRVNNGDILV